jgi:hypothetical protein
LETHQSDDDCDYSYNKRDQVTYEGHYPEYVHFNPGNKLQMFRFAHSLFDVEQNVEGRDEGHAEADVEGQLEPHAVSLQQLLYLEDDQVFTGATQWVVPLCQL